MNFQRAESLREGERYWLYFASDDQRLPWFTEVTFVDFAAFPTMVIVQDIEKVHMRCNRLDLYTITEGIRMVERRVAIQIPHSSPLPY